MPYGGLRDRWSSLTTVKTAPTVSGKRLANGSVCQRLPDLKNQDISILVRSDPQILFFYFRYVFILNWDRISHGGITVMEKPRGLERLHSLRVHFTKNQLRLARSCYGGNKMIMKPGCPFANNIVTENLNWCNLDVPGVSFSRKTRF